MSSLYDRVAGKPGGEAVLAAARLRREVLVALHQAFAASGLTTKTEVARRLDIRRSAVSQVFRGDGNLRINTLAECLFTLGFELDVKLVLAGEPRRAELEGRNAISALSARNTTYNVVFALSFEPGDLGTQTSTITTRILDPTTSYRLFDPLPDSTSRQIVLGELVEEAIDGS
jgi:transcriptional regulator with XRE-family HTH domain